MMATARGPGWGAPTGASSVFTLDDAARRPFVSTDLAGSQESLAQDSSIRADVPPPNPPFVFPARLASPSSAPSLHARAGGPRPVSIAGSDPPSSPMPEDGDRPRKALALPAFSFNPGASLGQEAEPSAFLSPPITPTSLSPRLIPSPSGPARHGHRRGGSEFVGGSIRDGSSIAVMSTSPTKSDSGFASSPGLVPPTRGHRRVLSGAISAHDLPQLWPTPAFNMPRGSSAPNSPTYFTLMRDAAGPVRGEEVGLPDPVHLYREPKSPGDAALDAARPTTPVALSSDVEPSSPRQARLGRTRVGFSDKLEFIPRPLSLVSSDTSSTATARPGHSVSGSMSSVVSVVSPCARENTGVLSRSPARDVTDLRPSTAGAVLERVPSSPSRDATNASPRRRNSTPTLLAVAEAQIPDNGNNTTATPRAPKRWSFFGFEPSFMSSAAPTKPRPPSSSSSSDSISRGVSGASSSDHESDSTETGVTGRASGSKPSKKKRVRGWAGSILPRKPKGQRKHHEASGLQPPTPPASVDPLDDDDDEAENPETPGPDAPAFKLNVTESPALGQGPRGGRRPSRDDGSYPMIDLDAALGPFNTPLAHNPEWDAAQRAADSSGKKRMHSAQGMKGFSGPGMHYHRRAESAPDLPPFDHGRSGIHRFGSNSTMADVFEEDEDEEGAVSTKGLSEKRDIAALAVLRGSSSADGPSTPPTMLSPLARNAPAAASPRETVQTSPSRAALEAGDAEQAAALPVRAECSRAPLQDEVIVEEPPSIIFCSADGIPSGIGSGSDSSTTSPKRLAGAQEISPVKAHAAYFNGAATLPVSPHPSPRSVISMEAQRMSTAPSSVADKNSLQSLLMGEPGPEVRISADYDMRSLNSSTSTTTRDSTFAPSQRMSQPSLREQRPVSVSSAAFGRRRSSLVSLSRLISSAHGERSKLSMEVTLDNEPEMKKSRSMGSKTKERLGRMMQFWKPNTKDGAPA